MALKKILFSFIFFTILQSAFSQGFDVKPMALYFDNEYYSSQTITIKNTLSKKTEFVISMHDYTKNNKGSLQLLTIDSLESSCSNVISFFPAIIEIDSMSEKTITVKYDKTLSDSTLKWGMMTVKAINKSNFSDSKKAAIIIHPQIGIKIYCNNDFNQSPDFFVSEVLNEKEQYAFEVKNNNNSFSRLNLSITITNIITLEEKTISEISTEFLPKSIREFDFKLPEAINTGNYSIAIILKDKNKKIITAKELIIKI